MALYDWNRDGKKDYVDNYLEYNIYTDSMNNNSYGSSGTGFLGKLFIAFVIFYVFIYIFGDAFTPNPACREFGCVEEQMDNSIYCKEHQYKNR